MEKLKYAFNKIKNGFIMFFCIIWISMIASFMAVSRAEGGAEVNGFLCFIFWIICVFLAVKKTHPVIISVISTVVMLGIRVYKFGIGDISIVAWPIMEVLVTVGTLYLVYRAIVPDQKTRGTRKTTTYQQQTQKTKQKYNSDWSSPSYGNDYEDDYEDDYNDDYEKKPKVNRREVRRTSDYSNSVNEEKRYGLINGSDEYWEYKDTAEKIYWDFCEARTTDARRMYKQEGETLKRKMISKYGADDESVKTIIERFLDLRV